MRRFVLVVTAVLAAPLSAGDARDRALRCEEIRQRIETLYSRMRSGYTRAEGEKMEAELRKLRALRAKACR